MAVVAERGFNGAPTAEVARRAEISHAYLFRLYPTKSDLSVAVVQRCHQRIYDTFAAAAAEAGGSGEERLQAMGAAYKQLLEDRELLLVQLHSQAAAAEDPVIREAARAGFERIVGLVERESGAGPEVVSSFIATGMLMNVMVALDAQELRERWFPQE